MVDFIAERFGPQLAFLNSRMSQSVMIKTRYVFLMVFGKELQSCFTPAVFLSSVFAILI